MSPHEAAYGVGEVGDVATSQFWAGRSPGTQTAAARLLGMLAAAKEETAAAKEETAAAKEETAEATEKLNFSQNFHPRTTIADFFRQIERFSALNVPIADILDGLDELDATKIQAAWEASRVCCSGELTGDDPEREVYHPLVNNLMGDLCRQEDVVGPLKVVPEARLPGWEKEPDGNYVHVRDVQVNPRSLRAFDERKRTKDVDTLKTYGQVFDYGCRLMWEALDRGEEYARRALVVGFLTDFRTVRIVRVTFGTDQNRARTMHFRLSEQLPLGRVGTSVKGEVTDGFKAVCRCLAAVGNADDDAFAPPLDEVELRNHDGAVKKVTLGDRLGMGGFADAYAAEVDGVPCVIKVLRWRENHRSQTLQAEIRVIQNLQALTEKHHGGAEKHHGGAEKHHGGVRLHIPTFLWGDAAQSTAFAMTPHGRPVLDVARELLAQITAPADSSNRKGHVETFNGWLRAVSKGLLLALRHAHSAKIIHLDVRPANVVWVGDVDSGYVVLVDWGVSQVEGRRLRGIVGVPEFAATKVLSLRPQPPTKGMPVGAIPTESVSAEKSLDLESLKYTMLDIAVGGKRLWRPHHLSPKNLDVFVTNRDSFMNNFTHDSPYRTLLLPRFEVTDETVFFPEFLSRTVVPNGDEDDYGSCADDEHGDDEHGGAARGGGGHGMPPQ